MVAVCSVGLHFLFAVCSAGLHFLINQFSSSATAGEQQELRRTTAVEHFFFNLCCFFFLGTHVLAVVPYSVGHLFSREIPVWFVAAREEEVAYLIRSGC